MNGEAQSPAEYEAVIEGDRRFFERHRGRAYRVRHTALAEIAAARRAGQDIDRVLPGFRWFTAVHQIAPGVRVRSFFQAPTHCDTDVTEELAGDLFRRCEGRDTRELADRLAAALKQAGAL